VTVRIRRHDCRRAPGLSGRRKIAQVPLKCGRVPDEVNSSPLSFLGSAYDPAKPFSLGPCLHGGCGFAPEQQCVPGPGRLASIGKVEAEVDDQRDVNGEGREKNQGVADDLPRGPADEIIDRERAQHRHR